MWFDIPAQDVVSLLRQKGWQYIRTASGFAFRKDGKTFLVEAYDGIATMLRRL